MKGRYIVAFTGGSGAPYGVRVVRALLQAGARVDLLLSPAGKVVLAEETQWDPQWQGFSPEEVHPLTGWHRPRRLLGDPQRSFWTGHKEGVPGELYLYDVRDVSADIASGSTPIDAMIIAPCSMSTVAAIATGQSGNLIERAADVALKEGRRLVVMPRETPLHALHLENLLTLARLGVKVVPAMPGFYHRPKTIEDLVDFVADRLLRAAGADISLSPRWEGLDGKT
ncbi:MAG: UbiX family flavin prenyltransferase [Clostridiales bacterium]|nr:UbiX family flavin prenyltransferase [Clostridiales bacterium]